MGERAEPAGFDVFIAHPGDRLSEAIALDDCLREAGLRCFLDKDGLPPGATWPPHLARAMESSRAFALLIPAEPEPQWYLQEEIVRAVSLVRSSAGTRLLVPVYLDGEPASVTERPYGLAQVQSLDARRSTWDEIADRVARGVASLPSTPERRAGARDRVAPRSQAVATYRALMELPREAFEEVLYDEDLGSGPLAPFHAPQSLRAIECVAQAQDQGVARLSALDACARRAMRRRPLRVLAASLRVGLLAVLARVLPRVHAWLLDQRIVRPPLGYAEVRDYQAWFVEVMRRMNGEGLAYVPQHAAPHAGPARSGDVRDPREGTRHNESIRRVLRLLDRAAAGGGISPQLASISERSKRIRDIARVFGRVKEPVVLLGDPGTGKSVTLREAGRRLVERAHRRRRAVAAIYVPLGGFRETRADGSVGSVASLVEASLPAAHRALVRLLPILHARGDLVLLFDGMDEMNRDALYVPRIRALSDFAEETKGRARTLFSCRINDFTPDFYHRQVVISPFTGPQIHRYVRANLRPLPVVIEGRSYDAQEFAHAILATEGLGEALRNPLLLHLACDFVAGEQRWPKNRAELFEYYVRNALRRRARSRTEDVEAWVEESASGLARIAFDMTMDKAGTWIDVSRLAWEDPVALEMTLEAGQVSGVLLPAPSDDERLVRFAHHRLQEYLAARHIHDHHPPLDYVGLLDVPRWQEILVTLCSMSRASAPAGFLTELLVHGVYEPVNARIQALSGQRDARMEVPPEQERALADRVLFAARVLREVPSVGAPSSEGTLDVLGLLRTWVANGVLLLAARGRPTSQVKALWAVRDCPALASHDLLQHVLYSRHHWIRDQATGLLAARSDEVGQSRDLTQEIGLDLARGAIPSRFASYWRATGHSGAARFRGALFAAASFAGLCALVLATGLAIVMARTAIRVPVPIADWPVVAATLWLLSLLVAAGMHRIFGDDILDLWPCTALAALLVYVLVVGTAGSASFFRITRVMGGDALAVGCVLVLQAVAEWVTTWTFTIRLRREQRAVARGLWLHYLLPRGWIRSARILPALFAVCALCVAALGAAGKLVSGLVGTSVPLQVAVGLVLALPFIRYWPRLVDAVFRDEAKAAQAKDAPKPARWRAGLGYLVGIGAVIALSEAYSVPSLRRGFVWIVVGVVAIGVVLLAASLARRRIRRLRGRAADPRDLPAFEAAFRAAGSAEQAALLGGAVTGLGLGALKLLRLLDSLESEVKPGEAEAVYWPLVHQLQMAVRQETVEVDRPAAAR